MRALLFFFFTFFCFLLFRFFVPSTFGGRIDRRTPKATTTQQTTITYGQRVFGRCFFGST